MAADKPRYEPLTEGYERKGGIMGASQIAERPPAPPAMKPANGSGSSQSRIESAAPKR